MLRDASRLTLVRAVSLESRTERRPYECLTCLVLASTLGQATFRQKETRVKKRHIAVAIVAIVGMVFGVFLGGCGGSTSANAPQANGQAQNPGAGAPPGGAPGQGPGGQGGNMISGTIATSSGSSITVSTADGASQMISLSSSSKITVTSDGTAADLVAGKDVLVSATTNSDGTLNATSIQLGVTLPQGVAPAGVGTGSGTATPSAGAASQASGAPPSGAQGQGGGGPGGTMISGTITASDGSTITVKTSDGTSKTIALSSSTKITVTSDGTAADLVAGKQVVIVTSTNSDNRLSATSIQVGVALPQGMPQGTPPNATGSPSTTTAQ